MTSASKEAVAEVQGPPVVINDDGTTTVNRPPVETGDFLKPNLVVGMQIWGYVALLCSSGAWFIFTIDWLRRTEGYPSQKGMYRALKLWGISDIVVILTFALLA